MRRNSDEELRDLERRLRAGDADAALAYGRRLVRLGRATEDEAQLLDSMGPEAWLAWGTDGEYEWRPDDVEFGDAYAEFIEARDRDVPDEEDPHGDGTWTSGWSVDGLAVRRHTDGTPKIVRTLWTVDSSGNWDSSGEDEWPVGSPHAELDKARHWRDNRRSWVEYFAWMAGTYLDPIGELSIPSRREPDVKWRFTLVQRKERERDVVAVTKAARRRGKKWVSVRPASLSRRILDWLSVSSATSLHFLRTTLENLDVVRGARNKIVKDDGDSLVIEAMIEGQPIPPTDRQIVDAARRAEVRAGEELAKAEREVERLQALAHRCGLCNREIQESDGSWVDVTGGDDCDGDVHRPATEHERLLAADRPGDMERGVFECDRCGGTFDDAESHSTPDGQVICDACFEDD